MFFRKTVTACLLLICIFLGKVPCSACSLALHDWNLKFFVKISLPAPVLPVTEFDVLLRRMNNRTNKVYWIVEPRWFNYFQIAFFPMMYKALANLPIAAGLFRSEDADLPPWVIKPLPWPMTAVWYLLSPGESVGKYAFRSAKNNDFPLIIGSDRNVLKIALFSDSNSSGLCWQLVLVQEGRVRAVHASPKSPWAQEINARSYLSLIFFQLPLPGNIMNLSLYPLNEGNMSLIENEALTTKLLEARLLLPRPVSDFDPDSNEIPELPR